MLICICVYIYKYITTDLFLEYFRHWKRGTSLSDQTVPHQVFFNSEFYGVFFFKDIFLFSFFFFFRFSFRPWLCEITLDQPADSQHLQTQKEPAPQQFMGPQKKKNKWKRKQKGWVFKPSKMCVAWQLYVQKNVIRKSWACDTITAFFVA